MHVFFSPDYLASETDSDTTRKAGAIADALRQAPPSGMRISEPRPADRVELARLHDEAYVDAILTGEPRFLAASAGLGWDEGFARSVLASAGGCRDAASAAWAGGVAGSLSSGLHHAARAEGAGFCTINGVALAALAFLDAGASSVLVLDLDAHCGGGTADILGSHPQVRQVDVATDRFDSYRPTGGWTLDHVVDADDYLPTIAHRLDTLPAGELDAVVYNAGMDPHQDCRVGGLDGITDEVLAEREQTVFAWAASLDLPIAFALAGGYHGGAMSRDHLTRLHLLTIQTAATSRPVTP